MKRILIGATLIVAGLIGVAGASPVSAQTNEGVCEGTHIQSSGKTSVTVTADPGQLISGYCVKAGSVIQGDGPEYKDFDPPVPSVTITHSSGKNISHYVVTYVDAPPVEATPAVPTLTPPTCFAPGNVPVLANTDAYTYNYVTADGVTTVTVTANAGYVLVGETGPWMFPIAQVTGETCDDDVASNPPPPATPVVPTEAPTVGSVGGSVTGSVTPVVGSAGPLPAQAAPTQALPATGTSSWVLAFTAMALVLVGSGFVSFSRRFS